MCKCICACVGVCRCICTSVHICVLRPKVDISIFLSLPHLLFETDHPSAGITGTHSYTQLLHLPLQRVPRTQTQVLLLYSKHIPKRAISPALLGEDLHFIFLVMALLLIHLLGFFAGLVMCEVVEGMSLCVRCASVCCTCILSCMGTQVCAGACEHVCTCIQRLRMDGWSHLQLLSILYIEAGSPAESRACHSC